MDGITPTLWTVIFLSGCALILSLWATWRCYVPPQTRQMQALALLVGEQGASIEDLVARVSKRARQENVAAAREVREGKQARRDAIEEQALALLAQKATPAAQAALPLDPAEERQALRRAALGLTPTRH